MRYIALLRGINVGGNNKVSMGQLRACYESAGFTDVKTYINSGNILFSAPKQNVAKLVKKCEEIIHLEFGFTVIVMVLSADDFVQAIDSAPKWWAADEAKSTRNDALFVIPPTTPNAVLDELKRSPSSVDRFASYGQVVFWTLPMADYNKSVVPKIIGTPIYKRITIRSSTTTRKLYALLKAEAA